MSAADAEIAIAAAARGADVVRARYGTDFQRYDKAPGDFATDADIAAERAIRAELAARCPADAIIGEELGGDPASGADRTWLVDPLCGTLNFAARTPLTAVNVSLRSGGVIVAAAAADPFSGEIFWTDGTAAWVRGRDGSDIAARPDASCRLVDLNLDPPFLNQATFRTALLLLDEEFAARFGPRVLSTSLGLAWVADGRRAGYVTDGDLRDSVHFAAGIAVCETAGAIVTGLAGQPVHTGVHGLVAAADAGTHATLLACIGRQRHAEPNSP